jgi:hypothetical protein
VGIRCIFSLLRRICESKKEVVKERWRKLRNKERRNLYLSRSVVMVIKFKVNHMAGTYITCDGDERFMQNVSLKKKQAKRPLGRHNI